MKKFSKLFLFLTLCLIVISKFYASNGFCENSTEELRKAAEKGDVSAQLILGRAYKLGEGVPKDLSESIKWYRKAAEQGLATAQFNLGLAYFNGTGVPKDETEAVKWYRKAAEQGDWEAQYKLGGCIR